MKNRSDIATVSIVAFGPGANRVRADISVRNYTTIVNVINHLRLLHAVHHNR
jgi:hypothetical protein